MIRIFSSTSFPAPCGRAHSSSGGSRALDRTPGLSQTITTPVTLATPKQIAIALPEVDAEMALSFLEDEKLSLMGFAVVIGGTLLTLAACGAMNQAFALLMC